MMHDDNLHSRIVGVLKITLPLAALALMSTVFLFARAPGEDTQIPYAQIEEIAREPRVSGARMSGVASDGSVIELSAASARPSGDEIIVDSVSATIEAADGTRIDIRANGAELDAANRIARLTGLARLQTSSGFEMETAGLTANMETGRITSNGALEVQTPFGSLTAGQLVIETPDAATGQVMLFQNGVQLIYLPQE